MGALLAKPGAASALIGYHMSGQVLLESNAGGSLPTNYAGKALSVGG
jgi:hypothetical protein